MRGLLVRLKPRDPRRGHGLRRLTYRGIKFHEDRGRYIVKRAVADYLRMARHTVSDERAPPAFEVCTLDQARALDSRRRRRRPPARLPPTTSKLSAARTDGTVTTEDLPEATAASSRSSKGSGRKSRNG